MHQNGSLLYFFMIKYYSRLFFSHKPIKGVNMIDLKDLNLKNLGDILITGFVVMLIVALFHAVLSPILSTLLPTIFTTTLTLTDTLLLLLLVTVTGNGKTTGKK